MTRDEVKGSNATGTGTAPEAHVAEVLARAEIPVEHMPPLTATAPEHAIPEAEKLQEQPSLSDRLNRRVAWILAGCAAVLIGFVGYGMIFSTPPTAEHMGLSATAWTDYRAGERASIGSPALMGLTTTAWNDYRAGERAALATPSHMGLSTQAWSDYRAGERASVPAQLPPAVRGWVPQS